MKDTNEVVKKQKMRKRKKKNIKMFPFYRMVSWDLLFYYPILFLFLTQIKGLTASQVLFADAFCTLSNTFWQIPVSTMVEKLGKKSSLVIGNILYALSILAMIFMTNFYQLLAIQCVYALGYAMKAMCETNMLYDSLPPYPKRGNLFSKIEAKAYSNFFYFDGVASIIAGFTYAINGYIPMVLCFIACFISVILSLKFKDTRVKEEKIKSTSYKEYFSQLKDSMQFFKKSGRIKSLLLFHAIFSGMIFGIVNLRSSMLTEMNVPAQYFGIIFAILQIAAGITSRYQDKIQKILKNRTLTVLGIPVALSCIAIGFVGKETLSNSSLILVILLYLIQYIAKGPYFGLMSRYLNNFTNSKIRPKIAALKNLSATLMNTIISASCAVLLEVTTSANTFIVVGCLSTVFIVLILDSMRAKVGIKPEHLTKEDVKYSTNKPKIK